MKVLTLFRDKFLSQYDYILLAVVAAIFGFFRVSYQSLWYDESISIVWAARKSLTWIWQNVPKTDLHPPLYYSVLHFWQLTFGDSVFSIRALSVIFFVGSALLLYYLAKILFHSRAVAILTSLIFITNPFAVLYAQEVRSYSMLIFFVLLQAVIFYNIVYRQRGKFHYIFYAIVSLVLIYTNILALFALLAQFIIIIFRKNIKLFRNFFILYVVLFICYLPVIHIVASANKFDYSYYGQANGPVQFNIILKTIVAFAGFIGARVNILNGEFHHYGLLSVSLIVYGLMFVYLLLKIKELNRFLMWFFILGFGLMLVVAQMKFPVPDPKYFYIVFPFFILLLGNLILILWHKNRRIALIIFVLILGFNCVFLYNYYFNKNFEKENWKSAVGQIERDYQSENMPDKSGLVIFPFFEPYTGWQYYQDGSLPGIGAFASGGDASSTYASLDLAENPPKKIIYLSRFLQNLYDPNEIVRSYLELHHYQKTKEIKDTKVEFWRYELNK